MEIIKMDDQKKSIELKLSNHCYEHYKLYQYNKIYFKDVTNVVKYTANHLGYKFDAGPSLTLKAKEMK